MKKFSLAFRYTSSALVVLVALVFTVLEATLLITLDFTLYENQFIALRQLIIRLLMSSSALAVGVLAIVKRSRSFLPHGICLLLSSAVLIFFLSNLIGVYITAVSALFLISELLFIKAQR